LSWNTAFNLLYNLSQQTSHTLRNKINVNHTYKLFKCMYACMHARIVVAEIHRYRNIFNVLNVTPITYMWYLVTLSFNALIQYSIHNTQKWLSWCILQTRCWNVTDKGSEWKRQWENCNIRKHESSSNNTNENLHPNYLISSFQRFLQQKDLNSSLVSVETSHGTYVQHGAWMQLMALLNMRITLKMLLNFKNSM
jgi:hypothetical protein